MHAVLQLSIPFFFHSDIALEWRLQFCGIMLTEVPTLAPSLCAHNAGMWLCNFYLEVGFMHADQSLANLIAQSVSWNSSHPLCGQERAGLLGNESHRKRQQGSHWEPPAITASPPPPKRPAEGWGPFRQEHKAAGLSLTEVANLQNLTLMKLYCPKLLWFKVLVCGTVKISNICAAKCVYMTEFL